jgi:hypothetical protein
LFFLLLKFLISEKVEWLLIAVTILVGVSIAAVFFAFTLFLSAVISGDVSFRKREIEWLILEIKLMKVNKLICYLSKC